MLISVNKCFLYMLLFYFINIKIRQMNNSADQKPVIQFHVLKSQFFNRNDTTVERRNSLSVRRKNIKFQSMPPRLPQPVCIEETVNHLRMKEKFQNLYRRIQQITLKQQSGRGKYQRRFMVQPSQQISTKKINSLNYIENIQSQHPKSKMYQSKSIGNHKKERQIREKQLEIDTVGQDIQLKAKQNPHSLVFRKSRYKNRLIPIKKSSLSNNIRDYLSVEKINIKDIQQSILVNFKNKEDNPEKPSNLLNLKIGSQTVKEVPSVKIYSKKKFTPPFETYYYRDLIWKVSYSNERLIEVPQDYDCKVKVFLGPGNNSRLVKGIISRRSWYTFIDKIEQANFAWTQIKVPTFMNLQKRNECVFVKKKISYIQNSVFSEEQSLKFKHYWKQYSSDQCKIKQDMLVRNKILKIKAKKLNLEDIKVHNHFKNNYIIGNKKALFHTMSAYYKSVGQDIFLNLPLTFHINGLEDDQYLIFLKYYYQQAKKGRTKDNQTKSLNVWIVKPGEFTNRGNGIIVCLTLQEIKNILKSKQKHPDGSNKTYIVQKYIERPFLYKRRKFDLRHYMMISCINGVTKGYWYGEGYVRTTSSEYTLKFSNGNIHLTNDAVQKNLPQYGKYEKGNKISYEQLNNYMIKCDSGIKFWDNIYPKMKKIATDSIRACAQLFDPDKKTSFEIFGLDFMIDQKFDVWLIQINTNPCLQLSCPLLSNIIPKMLENAFEISLDSIFPPPINFNPKSQIFSKNLVEQNSFQLVYDQREQRQTISNETNVNQIVNGLDDDQDDVFQDDGQDWKQD